MQPVLLVKVFQTKMDSGQ